jgi:aspartyl-tRNA(Asn)/glutamyl-tRNA(Gln) amidotransferase subunit C
VTVSREEIERVARLSAIAVDAQSLAALTRQIGSILDYVSQLESLDTSGVTAEDANPLAGPLAPLRPDEPRRSLLHHPPAMFAPAFREGLFLVPRLGAVGDDVPPDSGA